VEHRTDAVSKPREDETMAMIPTPPPSEEAETLEARFDRLAEVWLRETAVLSSTTQMMAHPAFKEIVSMREPVIPLILKRLGKGEGHWDLALGEITGERPFPASAAGRITLIEQFWLVWGVEKGYLPPAPYPTTSNGPTPSVTETMVQRFDRLADRWLDETAYLSSTDDTVAHPAFKEIVSMGEAVIPLILRRMEKGEGHWFLALSRITGEKPYPPSAAGKIEQIDQAWFAWAKARGYVW
jgi:hypothetical protein